jgi:hypothetical protein
MFVGNSPSFYNEPESHNSSGVSIVIDSYNPTASNLKVPLSRQTSQRSNKQRSRRSSFSAAFSGTSNNNTDEEGDASSMLGEVDSVRDMSTSMDGVDIQSVIDMSNKSSNAIKVSAVPLTRGSSAGRSILREPSPLRNGSTSIDALSIAANPSLNASPPSTLPYRRLSVHLSTSENMPSIIVEEKVEPPPVIESPLPPRLSLNQESPPPVIVTESAIQDNNLLQQQQQQPLPPPPPPLPTSLLKVPGQPSDDSKLLKPQDNGMPPITSLTRQRSGYQAISRVANAAWAGTMNKSYKSRGSTSSIDQYGSYRREGKTFREVGINPSSIFSIRWDFLMSCKWYQMLHVQE